MFQDFHVLKWKLEIYFLNAYGTKIRRKKIETCSPSSDVVHGQGRRVRRLLGFGAQTDKCFRAALPREGEYGGQNSSFPSSKNVIANRERASPREAPSFSFSGTDI